jgi:hypothetical protein
MHISAKMLGVIGLIVVSGGVYALLRSIWKSPFLLLAVLLLSISGNLLWFSFSGMETMLFLALGILALIAYRDEKWNYFSILLGLMVLTRPEGAILAAAAALVDLWAHRHIRRKMLVTILICIAISAPWFLYLYWRTGHFLPTSAIGKRFTFTLALDYVFQPKPLLITFVAISIFSLPVAWFAYLLIFALGESRYLPHISRRAIVSKYPATFHLIGQYLPGYWSFSSSNDASRWLLPIAGGCDGSEILLPGH